MLAPYFNPHNKPARPCWHCAHFGGMLYQDSAAACTLSRAAAVRTMPASGCSGFLREVGADDEPERVPGAEFADSLHRSAIARAARAP